MGLRKRLTRKRVFSTTQVIILSKEDHAILNEALANPPAPNSALKKARETYLRFRNMQH